MKIDFLQKKLSGLNTGFKSVAFMLLMILFAAAPFKQAKATHYVGSDITYKCLDALGNYEITLIVYRDCGPGTATFCSPTCANIGGCVFPVEVWGADLSCAGTRFFTVSCSGVSVRDINPNPRCPSAKMTCDNLGCVTPGTLTPGIERYEFKGTVNIGPSSGIPASCCNIRFAYSNCCRNNIIQNITAGSFYTDAIVNRCVATYPDCNSPDLTNDPYAVLCSGQGFIFNNGAFDPDLDSLVYSFTSSLEAYGTQCSYIAPYSPGIPMPYTGTSPNALYPNGINVDALTGDIKFRPNIYPFCGVMALRMEQWRLINGVYVMVGVTRREIQMYVKLCDPNNPPTFITNPVGVPASRPKTKWEVCAGDQICFDIIAKDTDYNPPTLSDTTFLSWNRVMETFGATFTPNYVPANRKTQGPREDSYKVCWTPKDDHCKRGQPTIYSFTIKAVDSRCPYPGVITQAFSIRVLPRAKVTIEPVYYDCSKWGLKYVKDSSYKPLQTFQNTTWTIARNPGDWDFSQGTRTYSNVASTPMISFQQGGKYLVELIINMLGPTSGGFCTRTYRDTLIVDTPLSVSVRDTFVCLNSSVKISASGKNGVPSYFYRWFNSIKDTLTPLNGPQFTTPTFNVGPPKTRTYTIRVSDLKGCTAWDSLLVRVKNLPEGTLLDSSRICYGDTFALDAGNNNGNIRSWQWNTGDTTQVVTRRDSNTFVVLMTDTFGCENTDTMRLKVNARIIARAGLDTFVCQKDTTVLLGTGGSQYEWKNLTNGQTILAKTYQQWVKVAPTNLVTPTKYQVRVYQSYPDTTNKVLECSAVDTVVITVKPLPTLNRPSTPTLVCYGTTVANLYPFTTPVAGQQGGTGVWTYSKANGAIAFPNTGPGITTTPQVRIDSLKNLPSAPGAGAFDNYVHFTYTDPTYKCKNTDSAIVKVYNAPAVDAGKWYEVCQNQATFELTGSFSGVNNAQKISPVWASSQSANYSWSGPGIDSTLVSGVKRFYFNPNKTGILKAPAFNTIKYTNINVYGLTYNFTNYTTNCGNSDTTRYTVIQVPVVDAGSEITVCKNEPIFNIADKSGGSVNPSGGKSYWYTPAATANTVGQGIVTNGTEYNASKLGVPYSIYRTMIIFKDTSTKCLAADTTYLSIVGYPKVDVAFSTNKFDTTKTVCRYTGKVDVYTWINDTLKVGYTSGLNKSYLGTTAWYPLNGTGENDGLPKAYFDTDQPDVTPGTHRMLFRYSQSNGILTCANTAVASITIEQPPVVTVTPGGAICAYDNEIPVLVDVQPSTYNITWTTTSGGGGFADAAAKSTMFQPSQGTKDAGGTWVYASSVQDNTCAPKTDSTMITVHRVPVADYVCPDCDGCEPLTSNINAAPTGVPGAMFTWEWQDGYTLNTTDSNFTRTIATFGSKGDHPYRLIVTSGESTACKDTSAWGAMIVRAKPTAGFTYDPPYTTIAKPFFTFTNTSSTPDNAKMNFIWDLGFMPGVDIASRTSTEPNPKQVEFKEDTTLVKMRVETEYGCWDTTSTIVKIEPDITVFTPNAFYPNSVVPCPDADPECNRSFKIAATGYATVEIFVFNRWGQRVYYSTDADAGWNGQINNTGQECPQDVYIYQVNATSFNGKLYKYSGSITLLR